MISAAIAASVRISFVVVSVDAGSALGSGTGKLSARNAVAFIARTDAMMTRKRLSIEIPPK